MIIPGSNLLNMALRVIQSQPVNYFKFFSRSLNNEGNWITTHYPPEMIRGSVQPVPRNLYEKNGLEFEKNYINFYTSNDLIGVERDISGDQISWNGRQYQCLSTDPWIALDGWSQILCVDIGGETIYSSPNWGFDADHANFDNGNFYAGF